MIYDEALVLVCSISVVLNILLLGRSVGWKRQAKHWQKQFLDKEPDVKIYSDPYATLKRDDLYDWEGSWD